MRLHILLDMDNASFIDDGAAEVARILAALAERLPDPLAATDGEVPLIDHNGNHVGTAEIID